jgi:hypothetical protein
MKNVLFLLSNSLKNGSGWTSLSRIGNSKISSTSYFWVIAVPVFSKIIETYNNINGKGKYTIFDVFYFNELHLPFSWEILFFSALMFSFANSVYHLFCPGYIKFYKSFDDFKSTGQGLDQLKMYFSDFYGIKESPANEESVRIILEFSEKFSGRREEFSSKYLNDSKKYDDAYLYLTYGGIQSENDLKERFWWVRDRQDKSLPIARWICYISYKIGSLFILIVITQNVKHVLSASGIFR